MNRPSFAPSLPSSAFFLTALAGAASSCGSPPAPEVPSVAVKPSPPAAGDPAEERCAKLEKHVGMFVERLRTDVADGAPSLLRGDQRERYLREWPAWCARAVVEKTRAECPGAFAGNGALGDALRDHDERRKEARFQVSGDGRWIIEWAGVHPVVRVWEAQPDALRLAWLLGPAENCAPVEGAPAGRMVCHVRSGQRTGGDDRQYLLVLDTAASAVRRLDDVEGWQLQGNQLLLASSRRVRRLDWTTLDVGADVPEPKVDYASPFQPKLLAGGRTALLGDTLVSLESGAVLAGKLEESGHLSDKAISVDGSRLLACVGGSPVLVDAATGHQQPISGKHDCEVGAAFTADGRRAVGANLTVGASRPNGASEQILTPFVADVATGAAKSVPAATVRVARRGMWGRVYLPADRPGRVCVSYLADAGKGTLTYGDDTEGDVCPWQIDASGALSSRALPKKAPPPDPLSPKSLGLSGDELTRAASPDGSSVLVATATAHLHGDAPPSWDLSIAEVSVDPPKVKRVLRAALGDEMSLSWADPPVLFVGATLPGGMSFLGPSRAVLATDPPQVIDLAAGTILAVDGEHIGGRWAVTSDHGALIDLSTMKRFALDPDEASWRAVKSYGAQCPERPEDVSR
jgi:hypothetical protein